ETDLIGQTTLPLTLTAGLPGPVTPPPDLPDRYVPPAGSPAPEAPPEYIEDYGSGGNDTITGGTGPDLLFGQSGDDLLRGLAGDDLLFGGPGEDRLEGGADDDQLFGGEGRDLGWLSVMHPVDPQQGDTLQGGAGDDRFYGQAGRDRLDGGAGDDLLMGGAGRDTFVFRAGHDAIADFDPLIDRLLLDPALTPGRTLSEVLAQTKARDRKDVILTLAPDDSLRLENTSDAAFNAADIAFL
ncbi:MAG: calcium-binding protein, partial [Pseudomonadota bacterium]